MLYRWLLVGMVTLLGLMAGPSWASVDDVPERADVRLVIDVSGSMKANDPENLRASGIRLLVDLLPEHTQAGLWTFGQQVSNPLAMGAVNAQWRAHALSVLPQLSRYEQFTDIEAALNQVTASAEGDHRIHLIMLTDGMVDVPAVTDKRARDSASRTRLIDQLAPELAAQNVVVHTIALSRNADTELMRSLSQQTGGLASLAEDSQTLLRSFLDVLSQVVSRQQLPLENGQFSVDDHVSEFTALIFHGANEGEVTLTGPDGTRLSEKAPGADTRWRHDDRYELITVPEPAAGEWHIEGPVGPGSRILIESALRIRTAPLPATLYQHFDLPLEVWLEGVPASATPAISAVLGSDAGDITSAQLSREDDSRYRGQLSGIDQVGNATLSLRARGNSFERLLTHGVNVAPAIDAVLEKDQPSILMSAAHPRLDRSNTRLAATLLGESLDVQTVDQKHWRVQLPKALPEEAVPVNITATVTLDGQTRDIALPPVQLNRDAATGIAGASLDRDAISGDRMAPVEADEQVDDSWSLQRVWQLAQQHWPQVQAQALRWAHDPRAWWVAAAWVLLWLMLVIRRRRRRQRRPQHRKDPSV